MSTFEYTYPLTMPSDPAPRSSLVRPVHVIGGARSTFTLHENLQKHQGFAWQIELDFPPMKLERNVGEWRAFLMKLQGRWGTFRCGDPDYLSVLGNLAAALTINGAGQTGNRISASYAGGSFVQNLLFPGAYIQIDDYMHLVTNTPASDSVGDVSIDIEPPLRTSPINGALINTGTPTTIFRLDEDPEWSSDELRRFGLTLKATEAVPNL